jgi:hypothetical protein
VNLPSFSEENNSAKIGSEAPSNQCDRFFPTARHFALLWAYQTVRGVLWRMLHGEEWPQEYMRLLADATLADDTQESAAPQTHKPIGDSLFEDYQAHITLPAEPELFASLLRAKHPRTVRTIVNRSRWLRGSRLGLFLWESPERFLAIKRDPRYPKSLDNQMEFLSRTLGARLAGYEPSTGARYLSGLIHFCVRCKKRPSEVLLNGRYWCGTC